MHPQQIGRATDINIQKMIVLTLNLPLPLFIPNTPWETLKPTTPTITPFPKLHMYLPDPDPTLKSQSGRPGYE